MPSHSCIGRLIRRNRRRSCRGRGDNCGLCRGILLRLLLLLYLLFLRVARGLSGCGKALPVLAALANDRHVLADAVEPVADGGAAGHDEKKRDGGAELY